MSHRFNFSENDICNFPQTLLDYSNQRLVQEQSQEPIEQDSSEESEWRSVELPLQPLKNNPFFQTITQKFNDYVNYLARKIESHYEKDLSTTDKRNILTTNEKEEQPAANSEILYGFAFIPYYRESTVLRRLCTINDTQNLALRFQHYETPSDNYVRNHSEELWSRIITVLNASQNLIGCIKSRDQLHQTTDPDVKSDNLKSNLESIENASNALKKALKKLPPHLSQAANDGKATEASEVQQFPASIV